MFINNIRYAIISPVRNESLHIEKTILAVISQTIQPEKWIIVNDGSTDNTSDIVRKYSLIHKWIHLIDKENRGYAEPGRGVMEAFYHGYNNINIDDYDYIVKLDGDLDFQANYFESIFHEFGKNNKLGIASGVCFISRKGKMERENHPEFHVRGASKVYKVACWKDIGGLIEHRGWDIIDEMKAQSLGWETKSFQNLHIIHYKPTGYNTGSYKWTIILGKANYYCGYHPLFVVAKCIKRMFKIPYIIGGLGILYGYFNDYIKNSEQVNDRDVINFIQKEQINKLTFRKSIWD
jgi:glycosyltransferase involved in cell wall biosynthesis